MRKILLIFLLLLFGCNSPTSEEEKDGFYTDYYLSGNMKKQTYFVNGNLSSITLYYNNSSNSVEREIFASSIIFYDSDGRLTAIQDYYLNGNSKSYTKFDENREIIAALMWDSSNDNLWGFDETENFLKTKPRRMNTDDYWRGYCKKDKENSNHSWDRFFDSNGKLVWRCRGVDNGQFVKNCNCKLWVKQDSRWPGN
tara:strand:+ start:103 stop:693 length:591 start_codon:yes stop_codon:yes gene_type:complete